MAKTNIGNRLKSDFKKEVLTVAIAGAIIPAVFWGIWFLAFGYIPKFLGIPRFLFDVASGPFYSIVLIVYIGFAFTAHGKIAKNCLDVFMAVDFAVSIFFSFAAGLAGIIALSAIIGIFYGFRRLLQFSLYEA